MEIIKIGMDMQNGWHLPFAINRKGSQLTADKYPRTTCEYGNHVHMCACVSSYSEVDAVEQRHVVNSGARGEKKDRNPRSGWIGVLL